MATLGIKNPKKFGLDVNKSFADVRNPTIALQNINLPPLDLQIIAGSKNAGATLDDWRSFSRLENPIYKTLDRFNKDADTFSGLLVTRAGVVGTLFGNLKINGSLSGSAIRYRYLDGVGSSAQIKFADISTSRISAWSSSDSRANNPNPSTQGKARIGYGARVGIRSDSNVTGVPGKLIFGTQSTATETVGTDTSDTDVQPNIDGPAGLPRLQTSITPLEKEFPSEFPTHKVKIRVDGSFVELYAMKGIPVVFKGFFRNLDSTITLDRLIDQTPPSWKIIETGNANNYVNFTNQGGLSSSISFRSAISRERFIQFYYNPDRITTITLTSAGIRNLPTVKFKSAVSINFAYNELREFPNLVEIAPVVTSISLMRNPFYLSEIESERKIQNTSYTGGTTTGTVLDKIPTTLISLNMEGTFYGSITQNVFADRFTNLSNLNFSRGGGAYFHPDSVGINTLPNVAPSVETYSVGSNDFRSIELATSQGGTANGTTRCNVKQLDNLVNLDLSGNYYLTDPGESTAPNITFRISPNNNVIKSISLGSTGLPIPVGVKGKVSLETYYGAYQRAAGSLLDSGNDYKFDFCSGLKTISLYAAGLSNTRFPVFTNINLTYLDLRYTGIKGGAPDGNEDYVIHKNTFAAATKLNYILIDSGNLLSQKSIHPEAFIANTDLYYFWYRSYGRTIGPLPSFGGNPNLTYLWLQNNGFTGSAPNFATNPKIYSAHLPYNKLSGTLPTYQNRSSLYYLGLYNNNISGINKFENMPALRYLYLHNNVIQGEIPDFTECPKLYYLLIYNNLLRDYKKGSFKELYNIRYIDLSNNRLTQTSIDNIIDDLYENYQSINRGGITVNLRANTAPSQLALDQIEILRSKGWNITHDT